MKKTYFICSIFTIILIGIAQKTFSQVVTNSSLKIMNEFRDSVAAKAKEVNLIRLSNKYISMNPRKSAMDSLQKDILTLYPEGITKASKTIQSYSSKEKIGTLTIEDVKSIASMYPTVDLNDPYQISSYYYSSLIDSKFPVFFEQDSVKLVSLAQKMLPVHLNARSSAYLNKNEHLELAAILAKYSINRQTEFYADSLRVHKEQWTSDKDYSDWKMGSINNLASAQHIYAQILYKQNNVKGALSYGEAAFKELSGENELVNTSYIKYLIADSQLKKALKIGESLYTDAKGGDEMKTLLISAYKRLNVSSNYSAFISHLDNARKKVSFDDLKKKATNMPAANFSAKDIQGNIVKLSDLKGKIVILDFWATWCIPCKMSFPGMQLAINKYKSDKDVVFLFIDTWESLTEEKRNTEVAKFIKDNGYTFQVLMDNKLNGEGQKNYEIAKAYNIDGVPTKLVIGKDGKLKFKIIGYSGSNESVVKEVSDVIDFLKTES